MAIDVEFEWQAVFAEGVGEEVQIGQQVFAVKDARPRAEAGAVVEEIQEGILAAMVMCEPRVRCGVELPEGTQLEALPSTSGG